VRLRPGSREAIVQNVIGDGAGERAGIAPGDIIVAVDALRATAENMDALVARAAADGGGVTVHLFRRDELLQVVAFPTPSKADTCDLMLLDSAPEAALLARSSWLTSAT
jgi:predicted metalloprotease with PDZ domain